MDSSRLEAFSDGVIAIIITLMVFQLKPPAGASFHDFTPLIPKLLIYVLSFQLIGMYWNNHHHLFRATRFITARVMWSNLLLLLFISLIPFFTAWFAAYPTAAVPTAAYGSSLLAAGLGFFVLTRAIVSTDKTNSKLQEAVGHDTKGEVSLLLYLIAIPAAFISSWVAIVLYVAVALMWFIPDRRFEAANEK